uniref:Uncharacterized protein n=1 Tax=Rhizophora mucronata TaxID=61149 RepID=A0A2P2P9F7_RHIMU
MFWSSTLTLSHPFDQTQAPHLPEHKVKEGQNFSCRPNGGNFDFLFSIVSCVCVHLTMKPLFFNLSCILFGGMDSFLHVNAISPKN